MVSDSARPDEHAKGGEKTGEAQGSRLGKNKEFNTELGKSGL